MWILQGMCFRQMGAGSFVLKHLESERFSCVVNKQRRNSCSSGCEQIYHNILHVKIKSFLDIKVRQKCIKHTFFLVAVSGVYNIK
jgi:hypothetical protein